MTFLPYTVATMLESQRVSSIAGASLPHFAREDTTLGGYFVPKKTMVMANIRYVHYDEKYWKDPERFNPERWLETVVEADGTVGTQRRLVQHTNFIPFCLGKRRCLGENLAKVEYMLFGVSLLSNFDFKMENDSDPPTLKGGGLIHAPHPFRMVVKTRK